MEEALLDSAIMARALGNRGHSPPGIKEDGDRVVEDIPTPGEVVRRGMRVSAIWHCREVIMLSRGEEISSGVTIVMSLATYVDFALKDLVVTSAKVSATLPQSADKKTSDGALGGGSR